MISRGVLLGKADRGSMFCDIRHPGPLMTLHEDSGRGKKTSRKPQVQAVSAFQTVGVAGLVPAARPITLEDCYRFSPSPAGNDNPIRQPDNPTVNKSAPFSWCAVSGYV
jgi:hypothetical protein